MKNFFNLFMNKKIIYIIWFFVIFLLIYVIFYSKWIYLGQDYSWYTWIKTYLEYFYTWTSDSFVFNNIPLLIKHFPVFIYNYIWFDLLTSTFLWFFSIYIIAYIGLLYFFSIFNLNTSHKVILTIWYLFSLYWFIKLSDGHFDFTRFYIFLPYVFYFLYKYLADKKIKFLLYLILSIIFLQNIFITPYLTLIEIIIFLIIFLFIIFYYNKYLSKYIIFWIIMLVISLPILFQYFIYSTNITEVVNSNTWTKPLDYIKNMSSVYTILWKSFIWLGYWPISEGYWPIELPWSYYFPNLHYLSENFLYLLFRFIFISVIIFWSIIIKNKYVKIWLLIFTLSIFLQTFYFFLLNYNLQSLIETIIKFIPFFREPVWKVEWLTYIWIIFIIIWIIKFNNKKLINFVIWLLIVDIIINIFLYFTTFDKRYSTAYLDNNIYNEIKIDSQKIEKKLSNFDINKFINIPNNTDATYIQQSGSVFWWVDPMIWILKYNFFYKVWGPWIYFHNIKSVDELLKIFNDKWINLIIYRKNTIFLEETLWKDTFSLFLKFYEKNKEKVIYDTPEISVIYLWKNNIISSNSKNVYYSKINYTKYNVKINSLKWKTLINFKENFHKYWKIYLKNNAWILKKPLFENSHYLVNNYTNWWEISKDEVIKYVDINYSNELKKEGYPKTLDNWQIDYKYYKLNTDWSIDLEITLYFKPQSYFYLWLIISWTTFVILISYLWIDTIRNRRKNKLETIWKNQSI